MGWRAPIALALCLALAGCLAGSGPTNPEPRNGAVAVGEGGRLLKGVITDERIVPLADVRVTVVGLEGATMNTSEDGAFLFTGVPPGAYYIQTQRRGFLPQQVELKAVEANGPLAAIVMRSDFGVDRVAQLVQWTAFLQCGVAGTNPCYLSGSDNVHDFLFVEGKVPDWVQAEAVWRSTDPTGQATNSSVAIGWHDNGSRDWKSVSGLSPLTLIASRHEITANEGPEADRLTLRLFSRENVVANQKYEIFTTLFYGFTPRLGWTFAYDGPCDPPESCN